MTDICEYFNHQTFPHIHQCTNLNNPSLRCGYSQESDWSQCPIHGCNSNEAIKDHSCLKRKLEIITVMVTIKCKICGRDIASYDTDG